MTVAMKENDVPDEVVVKDDLTAEELRRLSDMVQFGECITFPNGVTVDKRPVAWPNYYTPIPSPPHTPGGHRCGVCGTWVLPNTVHMCGGFPTYPTKTAG